MFPGTYFPGGFFASGYWCKFGGIAPATDALEGRRFLVLLEDRSFSAAESRGYRVAFEERRFAA